MADSIYKGIQLFKNDSADLVGKYLQEMFVDTEGVHLRIYYIHGYMKLWFETLQATINGKIEFRWMFSFEV
jgi:hypothetical protein